MSVLNGHGSVRRYQAGDTVRILTPDNPRLNGSLAVIIQPTDWGAHVQTAAAATGQFRALHEEMVLALESPALLCRATTHDAETVVEDFARREGPEPFILPPTFSSEELGYTGDVCTVCGSFRVKRAGKCTVCEDCGTPSGCS